MQQANDKGGVDAVVNLDALIMNLIVSTVVTSPFFRLVRHFFDWGWKDAGNIRTGNHLLRRNRHSIGTDWIRPDPVRLEVSLTAPFSS